MCRLKIYFVDESVADSEHANHEMRVVLSEMMQRFLRVTSLTLLHMTQPHMQETFGGRFNDLVLFCEKVAFISIFLEILTFLDRLSKDRMFYRIRKWKIPSLIRCSTLF